MSRTFGQELLYILTKEHLTQKDAADMTGESIEKINCYINDKCFVSVAKAEALLDLLGYEMIIKKKGR